MDEEMKPLTEQELEDLLGPFQSDQTPMDLDNLEQPPQYRSVTPEWVGTGSVLFQNVEGGNLTLPFQQTIKYEQLEGKIRGRPKKSMTEDIDRAIQTMKDNLQTQKNVITALSVMADNTQPRIRELESIKRRLKRY